MVTRPADRDEPVLRVVRGDATPEEIAALVAVLLARPAGAEAPGPARSVNNSWSDRSTPAPAPAVARPRRLAQIWFSRLAR